MKRYRNIYWFLADTLSPYFLRSFGQKKAQANFIDSLIEKSCTFSYVISTGNGTYTSMCGAFTGFPHSVTGLTGPGAFANFNAEVYTIPEILRNHGYTTYCYLDKDTEPSGISDVPRFGWDVYMTGNIASQSLVQEESINGDCPNRRAFIELLKQNEQPKFVYEHLLLLHDLGGSREFRRNEHVWTTEDFLRAIVVFAEAFRQLYESHSFTEDDLIILSNDHGGVFDRDFFQDETDYPKCRETGIRTFVSLKGKGLKPQKLPSMISAVDIAPTLLDLICNHHHICDGVSRVPCIEGRAGCDSGYIFSERNPIAGPYRSPEKGKVICLRDRNWKYVYSSVCKQSEWLINTDEGDYNINRLRDEPERAARYRRAIMAWKAGIDRKFPEWYEVRNYAGKRQRFIPVVSILFDKDDPMLSCIASLLIFFGPPFEILLCRKSCRHLPEKILKDPRVYICASKEAMKPRGEWILHLSTKVRKYPHDMLYRLYSCAVQNSTQAVVRSNLPGIYLCKKQLFPLVNPSDAYHLQKELPLLLRGFVAKEHVPYNTRIVIVHVGAFRIAYVSKMIKRLFLYFRGKWGHKNQKITD